MTKDKKQKIIAIVGPTATGKSDLGVKLALKFNGEIISADSRQVYKGLDIGTGKITEEEMANVPHYMLDIENPTKSYSVGRFKNEAKKIVDLILNKNKLPIIVGGTGFYIDALVEGIEFPNVPVNLNLRKELEEKSNIELYEELTRIDPDRARVIDRHNKVRLVRAIEVAREIGKVPKIEKNSNYNCLYIGLDLPTEELEIKIKNRLLKRLKDGMVEEVEKLHQDGLSYERMDELGLEYRYISRFVRGKINKSELIDKLSIEIRRYAKRQRTWFKRNKEIKWFQPNEGQKIEDLVEEFLKF